MHLGYLPEIPPLYRELTVDEYLGLAARLHRVSPKNIASALHGISSDVDWPTSATGCWACYRKATSSARESLRRSFMTGCCHSRRTHGRT